MRVFILLASLFLASMATIEKGQEEVTIKVVEGKTFLVHVDEDGTVLHKYMEITEDLNVDGDLTEKIAKAKQDYEDLREREKDQIRFVAYDFLTDVVEPLALSHLTDLAEHYNNSYANQIVITLGKRPGNEEFLKEKEELLVATLTNLDVSAQDIEVKYKWDRGPEPTAFIKVNTTLRELPTL